MVSLVSTQNALNGGEVAPALWGRTDLPKHRAGASTCRNFIVDYRGGAFSRPGLAYVGTCKQSGSASPPRDIPFQFNINQGVVLEFGDQYLRLKENGGYVLENPIINVSVTNTGIFSTTTPHGLNNGDWIYNKGNTGYSGLTWIVFHATLTTFTVIDLFGNLPTVATASIGGTVSRLYTVVSPYAAVDLPYLKYTQSADVLTLTCVNQITQTEYPPYSLTRLGATNWVFTQDVFTESITPPNNVVATAQSSTTVSTWYAYLVTAVSSTTGEESIASSVAYVENNDISLFAGSNQITWDAVSGAGSYNVYAATPSYTNQTPVGVLFGYVGTALGTSFIDSNIIPDFTVVPPVHNNPFARGAIIGVNPTAFGSGYTQSTAVATVTSSTGSGAVIIPVVTSGTITGYIIQNGGQGYVVGDSISISDPTGTGATATLSVGPQTGTYPATCSYFQQRRVYASTLNNPDTYYLSQPGNFLNMDSSIPVTDSDAIVGTPWAQSVNGIQFMVPMPGGLVILTGKGAWQLNGGISAAITPSNQFAAPQAFNGCHDHVPPLVINYDILYVQAKGSTVRDLAYNFFVNIYTGTDLTVFANHLFEFHQIEQWAWSEEPFKVAWCIRDDGSLLCLTYLKETTAAINGQAQDVYAWSRHDTNGQFVSVASITESIPSGSTTDLPSLTDAVYFIVKRFVNNKWVYYSERLDNRIWNVVEDCFCVDSGLQYPVIFPNAILSPGAAEGANVTFTSSVSAFTGPMVGNVIRVGGGKAVITSVISPTQVKVNITQTIDSTVPNDPNNTPVQAQPNTWSISIPTTSVSGLNHLEGMEVAILADGSVIPNQTVVNGSITLPIAASQIVIGLPYTCQLQTLYMSHPEMGGQDMQTKRKTISAVGIRTELTRGLQLGADQIDASTQPEYANQVWVNMNEIKERDNSVLAGSAVPLFTGDHYKTVTSAWAVTGQIAVQQIYPLPAKILSLTAYWSSGDDK